MNPLLRKFSLTLHLTVSVGWIGAASAYLVLVLAGMQTDDAQTMRSLWIAMELIGWRIIVPVAVASLISGVAMSVGTPWGLFRHYWVVASLVLTVLSAGVLVRHMQLVSELVHRAVDNGSAGFADLVQALPGELLHAGAGILVLTFIAGLNVFKPAGINSWARPRVRAGAPITVSAPAPFWVRVVGFHVLALALLLVILHVGGVEFTH